MDIIKTHIKQYRLFIFWLVSDLYAHYKWKLSLVIAATFVGLSMQTSAVYICYLYAKALESNTSLALLEWEVFPRSSFLVLLVVATIVMIMTIVSAILVMKGRMVGLRLARNYTDYCNTRIAVLVSSVSIIPELDDGSIIDSKLLSKLSRKDSLYAGMIVRVLSFSLIHLGTTLVAVCALLIIDASLTLIVIFILFITAIFFYKKSIKAAGCRILLGKLAPGMSKENKILNDRVSYAPAPLEYSHIGVSEIFERGISSKFSKAFVNQRLVLEESNLLAQIVIGISIFLIILVQGNATIEQGGDWSALLVYLFAFSVFATSFARTVKMLTSINRFYPSVNGYSKFVTALSNQLKYEKQNADKYDIQSALIIDTNQGKVELRKGQRVAYVSPSFINKYQLSNLLKEFYFIFNSKNESYCKKPWLVSVKHSLLKTTMREGLLLPASLGLTEIKKDISSMDIEAKLAGLSSDFDKVCSEKDMGKINQQLLFLLSIVSGKHSNSDIIILDEVVLRTFSEDVRQNIFHYLCEKIVIVSFSINVTECLGEYGESIALFSDTEKIIGYVDFKETDRNKINNFLQKIKLDTDAKTDGNIVLEEDLDEIY